MPVYKDLGRVSLRGGVELRICWCLTVTRVKHLQDTAAKTVGSLELTLVNIQERGI